MKFNIIKCAMVSMLIGIVNICSLPAQNTGSVSYHSPEVELSLRYINGNKFQRDLLLFFDLLKTTHPIFAPESIPPFDINEICESGYEWAAQCDSAQALWTYLQKTVSSLNDGHTTLYPDYNSSLIYPFMFLKIGDKYYLYTVTREFASSLGKQIKSINRLSLSDVIQSFRPLFSSNNDADFEQKVKNQISFEILWENNHYRNTGSTLTLTFDDGTEIDIPAKSASDRDLVVLQTKWNPSSIRRNSNDLFRYEIIEDKSICYLQFNICEDQSSLRLNLLNDARGLSTAQIEQVLSKYPRFDMFLHKMFEEIKLKNIKTLVIDVRNNRGGNGSLCDVLLSWLKPDTEFIKGKSYSRLSPFWEKYYPQIAKDYREAFSQKGITYSSEVLYDNRFISNIVLSDDGKYTLYGLDYDELFVRNRDTAKIFKGNVIFIQDEGTYSSAGQLITDARDNNIGIVIGSESAFTPCHYGDMLLWILPNTGIHGSISYKFFERPDITKCTEVSIIPDFDIEYSWDDVMNGIDPYWKWIITNYGTN